MQNPDGEAVREAAATDVGSGLLPEEQGADLRAIRDEFEDAIP